MMKGNKQELFGFLSQKIVAFDYPKGKEVFVTSDLNVLDKGSSHVAVPCNHEEADTRLLVHLVDALKNGSNTCMVRTVGTDMIVTIIGKFHHLLTLTLQMSTLKYANSNSV